MYSQYNHGQSTQYAEYQQYTGHHYPQSNGYYGQDYRSYSSQSQAPPVQMTPCKTWPTSYERSTTSLTPYQGNPYYRQPTVQSRTVKLWRRTPLSVWAASILSVLTLIALVISFSTPHWRTFRALEQSQPLERFEGLWLYCVWRSDFGTPLPPHYLYQCYTIINRDIVEIFDQSYMYWIRGFTSFGLLFTLIGTALSCLFACSRGFQTKQRNEIVAIGFHSASIFLYGILSLIIYLAKSIEESTKGRMVNFYFGYSFYVAVAGILLQIGTVFCHIYDLCRTIAL